MIRAVLEPATIETGRGFITPLRCPTCGAPFRFTSSLTVHLMGAHALAGWSAILVTLAIDAKGGSHVA